MSKLSKNLDSMLGFAQRAGKISSGTQAAEKSIIKDKAKLIIVAMDISDNSIKGIREKCKLKGIPIIQYSTKEYLGHVIGKEFRAVISIDDQNFAKAIIDKWEGEIL